MPDFRALCARMADELDHYRQLLMDDRRETHALAAEARAALSEPEPVGPTDEELLELMPETMRDEFSYAARVCSEAIGCQVKEGIFRVCLNTAALEYARAVLARWGRSDGPAVPDGREPASVNAEPSDAIPADGEVAELVAYQRVPMALLERLSPPQPIAVSERLPGAEDCDEQGRCWIHMPDIGTAPSWRLVDPREIGPYHTHWLPAHALPAPGEGQT